MPFLCGICSRMFSLDEEVLGAGPILDIAAGASSFVAEAADRGWEAAAVDPLYAMTPEELFEHGKKEIQVSTHKLAGLERVCDWTYYGSLRNHRSMREASLGRFIEDYKARGKKNYMAGMLPKLPGGGQFTGTCAVQPLLVFVSRAV